MSKKEPSEFITQEEVINLDNATKFYKVNFQAYSVRLLTEDEYKEIEAMVDKKIGDLH